LERTTTPRTEQPGQNRQGRTAREEKPGGDWQERTARTGQTWGLCIGKYPPGGWKYQQINLGGKYEKGKRKRGKNMKRGRKKEGKV
jgi:hypothetical protein